MIDRLKCHFTHVDWRGNITPFDNDVAATWVSAFLSVISLVVAYFGLHTDIKKVSRYLWLALLSLELRYPLQRR